MDASLVATTTTSTSSSSYTLVESGASPGSMLLDTGIRAFSERSSSMSLALQERKVPTQEEIAQKKLTFNVSTYTWSKRFGVVHEC